MLIAIELLFIFFLAIVLFMIFKSEGLAAKGQLHQAIIEEYWSGKDRRKHPRFTKSLGVVYSIVKNQTIKNLTGKTVDISEGGVKLLLDEKLSLNTPINLKISISDSGETAEVTGNVVWTEDAVNVNDLSGKRLFYSGIKFSFTKDPSGRHLINRLCSLPSGGAGKLGRPDGYPQASR